MLNIPETFKKDYIHLMPLRNFCDDHGLNTSDNKIELLDSVVEYAGDDQDSNFLETYNWVLNTIYEGSKEICYKKIYINEMITLNKSKVEEIINTTFSDCPKTNLLSYTNTKILKLVNYSIVTDDKDNIVKISFVFSRLVLEGVAGESGDAVIYPIFIDIYMKEGFITSRCKAKSTIYDFFDGLSIKNNKKINTLTYAADILNHIIRIFYFEQDTVSVAKHKISTLMYNLFNTYSFTPTEVVTKIESVKNETAAYMKHVFDEFSLNYTNMASALQDLNIFIEKYISINGQTEHIFKIDREAYLVKISSDDINDSTKVDTTSSLTKPLQCTEAFFDSKKSIVKNKQCKKLHLCYNRNKNFLGSFLVQFGYKSNYGIIKTYYFPEESDLQNVLQTVFRTY